MTSSADDVEGGGIRPLTATDPARVGPYQLLGRLGAGGMGRVYLARTEGGRTVAVKVVHEELVSDTQFRERFRREISAARKVGERYTAPVLDAGPDDVRPWVATGYVPGLSLEQTVREHGPLPAATVRALAGFLLRALADIHATGIVHRDLKPSNVMLTAEGAKVIDFGIARAMEPSVESLLTSTGMVIGSPGFMSPEQVLGGDLGPGSDVFAVGCVLTYAATGKLAFGHGATNQHAINYRTVEGDPDLDAIGDPALRDLVARCLTKDLDQRPAVADLLADAAVAPAPDGGTAWLPADLLGRLARHTARLLDVDATPLREEPADRDTVGLLPPAGHGTGTGVMPEPGHGGGPQQSAAEAPAAGGKGKRGESERKRRNWIVALPVVAVLTVGGGTAYMLSPWNGGGHSSGPQAGGSVSPGGSSAPGSDGTPSGTPTQSASATPSATPTTTAAGKKKPAGGTHGGGSGGSGTSGGGTTGGSGSGGSSGGTSGGGSGGSKGTSTSGGGSTPTHTTAPSSAVPSYFVGTWKFDGANGNQPGTIVISRGPVGGTVVRYITELYMSHCENVARLDSVGNGGSSINVTSAAVDTARSSGVLCQTMKAAELYVGSQGGIYHLDDPSEGQGYHYVR